MKVSVVLIIAALVGVIGYLMGTEDGRQRRDSLMARYHKTSDSVVDATTDATKRAVDDAGDSIKNAAEELAS